MLFVPMLIYHNNKGAVVYQMRYKLKLKILKS